MPSVGIPTFRLEHGRLVPDNLRGNLIKLQDARRALNGMESQLASMRLGPMDEAQAREAHQMRGDNLRIWEILGITAAGTINRDIFQAIRALVDRNEKMARELHDLRNRLQEYVLREEEQNLIAQDQQALEFEPHHLPAPEAMP
jgi:hypothetical protein